LAANRCDGSDFQTTGEVVCGDRLDHWEVSARQQAIALGIPTTEVDWFLQELTGLDRLTLRLRSFPDLVPLKCPFSAMEALWNRRIGERVPIQYLLGVAPWREFQLQVSPAVLIPRPETELLIDLARQGDRQSSATIPGHWADLGTGSGAIALGLATVFPAAIVHAVDRSAAALEVARTNADRYPMGDRLQFYQGSWLEPLSHLKGQLNGIVSNPPYIPTLQVPTLQPEVARHEPHLALDGGEDGLNCIRQLIATAPDYLRPGGMLLFEMMAGQAADVLALFQQQGNYQDRQIHPDLSGIDRFALAYRLDQVNCGVPGVCRAGV